jgi:hypothetical protein
VTESKSNRFTKYFSLLLDALRSAHPTPMRPAEARAWIRSKIEVPADDLTRLIQNGKQSIFVNDVHWARFYLVKAHLIDSLTRGLWSLTPQGFSTRLSPEETWDLYVRVRDANRPSQITDEETIPARQFGGAGLKSGYLYQMYAYLRSQEGISFRSNETAGLLLHPAIDSTLYEHAVIQGHSITFATVNLTGSPTAIRSDLRRILSCKS